MGMNKQSKRKGAGRPAGSSGDITRARIIESARECFGATGFAATTNKQIAQLAGITAAAIYRYFDSKTALYKATVDESLAELEPVLRDATKSTAPGRATLVALAFAAGSLHAERPYLAAFLSSLPVEMQRNPDIAEAMTAELDPVSQLVATAVEEAQELGELARGVRPEHVAAMILACNIGLSLWGAALSEEPSSEPMHSFGQLLEGTLFAGPKA